MNGQLESLPELFGDVDGQRSPGRDAKPKLRQFWNIRHVSERLIENRHTRENSCAGSVQVGDDGAGQSIPAQHHRNTTDDERGQQVTEPVRVRNRNDAEVQIFLGNAHGVAI